MGFSQVEILQIEERGLSTKEVERQLAIFKRGNIKVDILEAATAGNGIFVFSEKEKQELISLFEAQKSKHKLLKFVPASGAASRMFQALHTFIDEYNPEEDSLREYLDNKGDDSLQLFFEEIDKLPFYDKALEYAREKNPEFDNKSKNEQHYILVKIMLYEDGLNLSNYPKGLVPFHKYDDRIVTAFEEHLYESAQYLAVDGVVKIHFTVAKDDKKKFEKEYDAVKERVEKATNVTFDITYSFQDTKTDTIAVNEDNEVFTDEEEGNLFFRPGGHGALIENLNNQEADVIFVKNIDNVVIEKNLPDVTENKRMLGGKLLQVQEQIFEYLKLLDAGNNSEGKLDEISQFLENDLFVKITPTFSKFTGEEKTQYLCRRLDKPIRVCGMVKNEGQPGGGPFLVRDETGEVSLQIIEGAQIDKDNIEQLKILNSSTHFNPVDIVCGVYNFRGEKFDLNKYVDESTSFIAHKTKNGKPLKALERPGLWNGGMAFWNTIFVEVPVSTFNPVKTVSDLLKPSHREV